MDRSKTKGFILKYGVSREFLFLSGTNKITVRYRGKQFGILLIEASAFSNLKDKKSGSKRRNKRRGDERI